ncbi:MAG: hypothetical protein IPL61_27835 [Myxococcales bacterium]|nr:hypothetical protein [Myxococcales bacterium]
MSVIGRLGVTLLAAMQVVIVVGAHHKDPQQVPCTLHHDLGWPPLVALGTIGVLAWATLGRRLGVALGAALVIAALAWWLDDVITSQRHLYNHLFPEIDGVRVWTRGLMMAVAAQAWLDLWAAMSTRRGLERIEPALACATMRTDERTVR